MKYSEINETFKDGSKVKVIRLDTLTQDEWDMTLSEYKKLLKHNNKTAVIDSKSFDGYYNITFDDGYEIESISDYHLKKA